MIVLTSNGDYAIVWLQDVINNVISKHNRFANRFMESCREENIMKKIAVVDAFGAWTEETLPQHSTSLAHLCDG